MQYIEEKNHDLRYVLKDSGTGRVYLVVLFTLVLRGTDQEPAHKEQVTKGLDEIKAKNEESNGSLGKFEWESSSSASDIE